MVIRNPQDLSLRAIRKRTFLALSILLLVVCSWGLSAQAQNDAGSVDWVLVLDTSASMRGAGGTPDIFEKVKGTIADFIRNTRDGDSIVLYTFDRDTVLRSNARITGDIDKNDLIAAVDRLSADGLRTHTGKAIQDALKRATELGVRKDSPNRTVSIVLFTDGLEDVRDIPNPVSIPSNVSLIPKDPPYLFFVSLGAQEHEKQLEELVKDPAMGNRGEVVRDAGAQRIAEVMNGIRKKIEAPPTPKEINLKVEPTSLDFGQIEPGEMTSSRTVSVHTDLDSAVRVTLANSGSDGLSMVEPAAPIAVKAGEKREIEISVKTDPEMADGPRTLKFIVTPEASQPNEISKPIDVEASINLVRVPVWRKLLKYLVLLLIALALIVGVISLIKGEPPWHWEIFPNNNLEGGIEVIRPRPPRPEDEFISLTERRSKRLALGSLLPNGSTEDSDAELATVRKEGAKRVRLRRTQGIVSVNGVEVAESFIYDNDVIELGNARVRFHWIDHEPPIELDEDQLN